LGGSRYAMWRHNEDNLHIKHKPVFMATIKKINFVAPSWGIDFLWFNAYYHRCSITTKSFQAKNLANTEKMSDQRFSFNKLYYSKKMWKFVFNCNKNDLDHQKAYQNLYIDQTFKQFFLYLKFFSSFSLSKTRFSLSTQSLLRHFGSIFIFKTAITQRLFEE
jgi:hypothetical protein